MPSSTFNFDRAIPRASLLSAAALAVGLCMAAMAAWEIYWRGQGLQTDPRNSDGLWIAARASVHDQGPRPTVILGASRAQFDIDLDLWADRMASPAPVQLALEGNSPAPFLHDLARDEDFSGFVVVGVAPLVMFGPFPAYRARLIRQYHHRSPSDELSHALALRLDNTWAFLDFDSRLFNVLARQTWPERSAEIPDYPTNRKLSTIREDRETELWRKISLDTDYRETIRDGWRKLLALEPPPGLPPLPPLQRQLDAMARDVAAIRERGGDVLFVRFPSSGPFLQQEIERHPRATHWDRLLETTGARGIHFADYPQLQRFDLPEWSHVCALQKSEFTAELVDLVAPIYEDWAKAHAVAP